jgi:hypothetical protein
MSAFHADDWGSNPHGSIFEKVDIWEWELRDFLDRNFFAVFVLTVRSGPWGRSFCLIYFQNETTVNVLERGGGPTPPRTRKSSERDQRSLQFIKIIQMRVEGPQEPIPGQHLIRFRVIPGLHLFLLLRQQIAHL